MFLRKFTYCRHKFSCFEHVVRTVYRTAGLYLMIRFGAKLLLKEQIFEIFAGLVRRVRGNEISNSSIADMGLALEINALLGVNLYLLK